MTELKKRNRNISLDFLRGTAVLLVITAHFSTGYFSTHIGWSGVDLFFVLSGFFVSGILFREYKATNKINKIRFLIRRAFKIWPLFYSSVILYLVYYNIKGIRISTNRILYEIFFLQDYTPGFLNITWSVGVEEKFYIFIIVLLAICLYYGKMKWIIPFCFTIMTAVLIFRIYHTSDFVYYDPWRYHYPLHLRADALCAGIIISYYHTFRREALIRFVSVHMFAIMIVAAVTLFPLIYFSYTDLFIFSAGFTCVYLFYAIIVILFLVYGKKIELTGFLRIGYLVRVIAKTGFYSYSIYLFHIILGFSAVNHFQKQVWVHAPIFILYIIFLTATIGGGIAMSKIIELPLLKLRDKKFPSVA